MCVWSRSRSRSNILAFRIVSAWKNSYARTFRAIVWLGYISMSDLLNVCSSRERSMHSSPKGSENRLITGNFVMYVW
ncbi:MAG TPA: hypothetical protein VNI20_06495 [Fimbriimonadaceae bacterium]|nr:hypothetical protein [Fimbriimonadaceae bacterium]